MRKRRGVRRAALVLALLLLAPVLPVARGAQQAGYVLRGAREGESYTLQINLAGVEGLGGRFAMSYDTEKVTLVGGDSFAALHPARGVSLAQDYVEQDELVNAATGSVGFAWYSFGLDATGEEATVASLTFRVLDEAFDAGTFRVRHIGDDFGTWSSPLSLEGKSPGVVPDSYAYLRPGVADIGITFAYEGADKPPAAGSKVTFQCRELTGAAVEGTLELNGRTYETDGAGRISLTLLDGAYDYRLNAAGYGPRSGVLTVSGETEQEIVFTTDQMLVDQAREELQVGYREGEGAQGVRNTVTLPRRLDSGVDVAWQSSNPGVLTHSGLVFRPEEDTPLTLTATLTRGAARAEKAFSLTVLAKEKQPPAEEPGGGSGGHSQKKPEQSAQQPDQAPVFQDLEQVPWAQDAILVLARAGVIQGIGGERFGPMDEIRRCDFLLLITRMMEPAGGAAGADFDDVAPGAYYYEAVSLARGMGLVEGDGANCFHPTQPITRQEMLAITARALALTGYAPLDKPAADLSAVPDGAQVAPWASEAVGRLVAAGYLVGNEAGGLTPLRHATRAEAAVFLYRLYAQHI